MWMSIYHISWWGHSWPQFLRELWGNRSCSVVLRGANRNGRPLASCWTYRLTWANYRAHNAGGSWCGRSCGPGCPADPPSPHQPPVIDDRMRLARRFGCIVLRKPTVSCEWGDAKQWRTQVDSRTSSELTQNNLQHPMLSGVPSCQFTALLISLDGRPSDQI